jgi:hypothetical protein
MIYARRFLLSKILFTLSFFSMAYTSPIVACLFENPLLNVKL